MSNGHVYPEVDGTDVDAPYAQHKYLCRNLRNGQFEEVTAQGCPSVDRLIELTEGKKAIRRLRWSFGREPLELYRVAILSYLFFPQINR